MVFPVVMYRCELDHKEIWALKNWCFQTVVLKKTLESPLDCKEIKPVNPKVNQSWIFIGRTDAKAEFSILWPPYVKSWLIRKDPKAGKDWRREEKGMTEDEMVGWHDRLNGHEFEQALGDGEGQGGLVCCSPWGHKELDITDWLNRNKNKSWLEHSSCCCLVGWLHWATRFFCPAFIFSCFLCVNFISINLERSSFMAGNFINVTILGT